MSTSRPLPSEEILTNTQDYVWQKILPAKELYNEEDIKKIDSNNWFIRRFVIDSMEAGAKDVVTTAGDAIIECMKWRKEVNIDKILKGDQIPKELLEKGVYEIDEEEKLMIQRCKKFKNIKEFNSINKMMTIYFWEKFDRLVGDSGAGKMIANLEGAGVDNLDIEFATLTTTIYTKYYPGILGHLIYYEATWYLKPPLAIITALMPERISKRITRVSKQELLKLMGPERLPVSMGGTRTFKLPVPPCAPSMADCAKSCGIPDAAVLKQLKYTMQEWVLLSLACRW